MDVGSWQAEIRAMIARASGDRLRRDAKRFQFVWKVLLLPMEVRMFNTEEKRPKPLNCYQEINLNTDATIVRLPW